VPDGITYLPYSDTGYFSRLVTDYLKKEPRLAEFFTYYPDRDGIAMAIDERKKYPVDRETLVNILTHQYAGLHKYDAVVTNIDLLKDENTFTVCTAHQPNLLTGYLYFVYKIIHAIKLAEELKTLQPENNFIPVYYMGSEDNDLDELGVFRYADKKFVWDGGGQSGAVGRMHTASLRPLLDELFKLLGPPGAYCDQLKELLEHTYLQHDTIAKATQYLVNELFGRYGLIVLDPDEAAFKKAILPVLKDDLLNQTAYSLVSQQAAELNKHYKVQATPRPINLFYLDTELRERIEKEGAYWSVLNTDIKWDETALQEELEVHPERFSPNVILRGILQETILPDVAFIGGGAEVAYWLQLKPLFEHYKVFYPAVMLRQSALWIDETGRRLKEQLHLSTEDLFKPTDELIKHYLGENAGNKWQTLNETAEIEKVLAQLKQKAVSLDPNLGRSSEAVLVKIKHQLAVLEQKMLRAEKRKNDVAVQRIKRLKGHIFPGGNLQERTENFISYYLQMGPEYFDLLKDTLKPLMAQFLVIEQ
jgi:bacillithiol biosynthesis cysteine-adding enzyme BshC